MDAARLLPDSTSVCTAFKAADNFLLSWVAARSSMHWTRGTPASIMTENCRVKTAMSFGVGFPPNSNDLLLVFFSCASSKKICSRRSASARACRLSAALSPETVSPCRFLALNEKFGIHPLLRHRAFYLRDKVSLYIPCEPL